MKLKTYIVSVFILASTLMGFTLSATTQAQAQKSNTRAIACNGCSESTKRQLVQKLFSHDSPQGQYRFVIVDMAGSNVHEYDVNVPAKNTDTLGQSSQQTTVTLMHRADQDFLTQRINDVKAALQEINNGLDELFSNTMLMPANSGHVSAYSALENKKSFNAHTTYLLANTSVISSKIRETNHTIQLMAESMQIGESTGFAIALTIYTSLHAWVTFADGSKVLVGLKLSEVVNEGFRITVTTTGEAVDKNGKGIPKFTGALAYYNLGHSGINESALQSYFNSIGVSIIYGSWSSGESNCATKWRCSSNGKTCELIVITDQC